MLRDNVRVFVPGRRGSAVTGSAVARSSASWLSASLSLALLISACSEDGPKAPALPGAPERPPTPTGISADALTRRIDEFLGSRGFKPGDSDRGQTGVRPPTAASGGQTGVRPLSDTLPKTAPLDFVCEDDVRRAIQAGKKLVVSERAIVTPAARDLAEQHRVFSIAPWRG